MSKLWNYRHKKIFNGGCHQLSKPYILNTLINYAENLEIKPQKQHYKSLQIDEFWTDEFWTYVGSKKNKKWLLYAYCPEKQEVVAYVFGDRSEKTIKDLYAKLAENNISVDEFCTDNWKAFAKILPKKKHKIGKKTIILFLPLPIRKVQTTICLITHTLYFG